MYLKDFLFVYICVYLKEYLREPLQIEENADGFIRGISQEFLKEIPEELAGRSSG